MAALTPKITLHFYNYNIHDLKDSVGSYCKLSLSLSLLPSIGFSKLLQRISVADRHHFTTVGAKYDLGNAKAL